MLSPEVWTFKPPPFSESTSFCESDEEIFSRIKYHYFNHHVSITLPDTMQISNNLIDTVLVDSQFYRVNKVFASELLKKDFLDYFVKKGQLTAISIGEISEQDSLVITPCGKLIFSVCQSTFQQLGIVATSVENPKSCMKKYFLVLDLTSAANEERKKCEQAQKKFLVNCDLCFDIVLAWEPEDPKVCPSSIAHYFSKLNHFVKTCNILHEKKLKYNVSVPSYGDECDVPELIEWLGAFTLDCDISEDDYISTFKCPEKSEAMGQVMQLNFTGLLTQSRVRKLISELTKYLKTRASEVWFSLSVQSFQNSIVKVKNQNLYFSEGDQNFTVIFKQNHPFLIYLFKDKK